MKIEQMRSIPSSRAELERNLFLLGEMMRAGRYHVAEGMQHSIDGLKRLRKLPNRRVDLLSLDEMTRLNANTLANMQMKFDWPGVQNDETPLDEHDGP